MNTKLIIIDGASTVGKSSISKAVYNKITYTEEAVWLHEECKEHPIRSDEFKSGDLASKEGMQSNLRDMLTNWKKLVLDIINENKIYILEGCLLHQLDRYLLQSIWSIDEIIEYYKSVIKILKPLNPIVIFLYRPDIKSSFQKAFIDRGDWWKNLILEKPDPVGYFKENEYINDESIYQSLAYEQNQMKLIFDTLKCEKFEIDTTNEKWSDYLNLALKHIDLPSVMDDSLGNIPQDKSLCGTYILENDEDTWLISWDDEKQEYYTSLFWPYMPMRYIGKNIYEFISFPITLKFDINDNEIRFKVNGNYDWEYNNKVFIKQN